MKNVSRLETSLKLHSKVYVWQWLMCHLHAIQHHSCYVDVEQTKMCSTHLQQFDMFNHKLHWTADI